MRPCRQRSSARRVAACLAVGLLAQPAVARDVLAQELRRLPLYDAASERTDLQVAVWEQRTGGDYPLADLRSHLAAMPAEVGFALGYLDAVRRGRLDRLSELHGQGADLDAARQAAALYRRFLKGLPGDAESVQPLRTWHFGPYRVVVLRLLSEQGAARVVTVSLEAVGEGFVRRDDWGARQPVHELFWYLAGTLNAAPAEGSPDPARDFSYSVALALDGEDSDLRVELDGVRYSDRSGDPPETSNAVRDFVHRALTVAEGGEDRAFIDLWDDEGRRWLTEAMAGNRPIFNGSRAVLRGLGTVRDRFTLPLGDFAMHYFTAEAEPQELRHVLVRRQADGYGLSDRLPHNLQTLLSSRLFRQALQQQILGSGG